MANNDKFGSEQEQLCNGISKIEQGDIKDGWLHDSPPFLFSNENLYDCFNLFDFNNKKVLTVAGSGDQAFEAYFRGAKQVDTFDCNLFQKYVYELKNLFIRELSYSDFMTNFFDKSKRMNPVILKKIMPKLSFEAQFFFNSYHTSNNQDNFFKSVPFWNSNTFNFNLTSYVQSEENYNYLKEKLPEKISFVQTDIKTLPETLHGSYDIIYLSNIFEGLFQKMPYQAAMLEFLWQTLPPLLKKNLNSKGGIAVVGYLWGTGGKDIQLKPISINSLQELKSFAVSPSAKNLTASTQQFKSAVRRHFEDGIVIVTKDKTR